MRGRSHSAALLTELDRSHVAVSMANKQLLESLAAVKDHEEKIAMLKAEMADAHAAVANTTAASQTAQDAHRTEIATLEARHGAEVASTAEAHQQELDALLVSASRRKRKLAELLGVRRRKAVEMAAEVAQLSAQLDEREALVHRLEAEVGEVTSACSDAQKELAAAELRAAEAVGEATAQTKLAEEERRRASKAVAKVAMLDEEVRHPVDLPIAPAPQADQKACSAYALAIARAQLDALARCIPRPLCMAGQAADHETRRGGPGCSLNGCAREPCDAAARPELGA
jgi:chromosome segregation ATPase